MWRDVAMLLWPLLSEARAEPRRLRVPEPMVMTDPESVEQFHRGGGSAAGMRAVYDFSARALSELIPERGRLLDLGIGSGQAIRHLLDRRPDITVTGLDLSEEMLSRCAELFESAGAARRVRLIRADISRIPAPILEQPFDAVCSVWTLHQLPDLELLGDVLEQIAKLRERHGSAVWLLDFQRLRDRRSFPAMMRIAEPGYPPVLLNDALASEAAAFGLDEMRSALVAAGLDGLRDAVLRPLPFLQAHWCTARGGRPPGRRPWREIPVSRDVRLRAALTRRAFSARP
jgi:tRNA (cmo5U34)-methyltransferase